MKQSEFKDYILSLGFIDSMTTWNSSFDKDDIWFTWPGSRNSVILLKGGIETFTIFSDICIENGQIFYGDPIQYEYNEKGLKAIEEMRDKIINFKKHIKKQQRFKIIEEL